MSQSNFLLSAVFGAAVATSWQAGRNADRLEAAIEANATTLRQLVERPSVDTNLAATVIYNGTNAIDATNLGGGAHTFSNMRVLLVPRE